MEETLHVSPGGQKDDEIISSTSDRGSAPEEKEQKMLMEAEEEWFNFVMYQKKLRTAVDRNVLKRNRSEDILWASVLYKEDTGNAWDRGMFYT